MELTLQNKIIQGANKVPGNRVLMSQVFGFLINIDHLWFYAYHKDEYGDSLSDFFDFIRKIQNEKWNVLTDDFLQ
jgi:hypothetical protein